MRNFLRELKILISGNIVNHTQLYLLFHADEAECAHQKHELVTTSSGNQTYVWNETP